ncbi:hypothetical protein OROGR_008155 [Orobanche gracilis]
MSVALAGHFAGYWPNTADRPWTVRVSTDRYIARVTVFGVHSVRREEDNSLIVSIK